MKEVIAPAVENQKIEYMPRWFKITMVISIIIVLSLLGYLVGFLVAYSDLLT